MQPSLAHALKEWAVICQALRLGRQAILLRKGGIAEPFGDFQLEATRFWLFPTYVHQQDTGIRPEALPLLEAVKQSQPPAGKVRLAMWAEVTGVYQIRDLLSAHLLAHLHVWSDDAIEKRFHYRSPGINALAVRVHHVRSPIEIDDLPSYQGCKSWVPLAHELPVIDSTPILDDNAYQDVIRQLDTLLRPTASV